MGYTKEHESLLCSSMSTHLILIVVVIYLLFAAKQSLKNRKSRISFRYLRPRHFLRAFVALVLVVLATALLLMPKSALRWGWWSAIGGSGNVILGQTANSVNSAASTLISIGIVVLVMSILSQAAFNEEIIFRYGDEHRPFYKRLRRSIVFGLEHMIMGIPLGTALALTFGGLSFSAAYRWAHKITGSADIAVIEATLTHIAFNLTIMLMLLSYLLFNLAQFYHL